MCGDEHLLALLDEREDLALVVRERALGRELERFAAGGRDVVRAAPDVDLLLAKLLARLVLVEAGQVAIVTFR